MALIKCPECGREKVSDKAESCPGCGYGIKEHFENVAREAKKTRHIDIKEKSVQGKNESNNKQKPLQDTLSKKVLYGVFVVLVLIFIIVFIIITTSENEKKCTLSGCDNYKMEGGEYCREHTCKENGCTSSKFKYDNYCSTHQKAHMCEYYDCENYRVDGGEYCYEHTCAESGCYNKKGYGSDYCTEHQVDMRKKLGNEFSFVVNSAGGIELNFRAKNNSGKEIKYIRFDVEFSNAVGDKIQDEITDKYSVSVEVVGPIANGKSANFKDIIGYNDNCARIDIGEVTLIYTDGTSQTGHYGWYTEK